MELGSHTWANGCYGAAGSTSSQPQGKDTEEGVDSMTGDVDL
jgi:hypothetical protein